MHFRVLGLIFLLFSGLTLANSRGRAPAVEDFVGMEVEHIEATPQGTEPLFNLEQDLNKHETTKNTGAGNGTPKASLGPSTPWSLGAIFGLIIILGLPIISWLLVMNHLRQKASQESASNIEVLEKYRQEREQARNQNKDSNIKKAS